MNDATVGRVTFGPTRGKCADDMAAWDEMKRRGMPESRLNGPLTERDKANAAERAARFEAERKGKCPASTDIGDVELLCDKKRGHSGPHRDYCGKAKVTW